MDKTERTAGDGMDNFVLNESVISMIDNDTINFNRKTYSSILKSLKPIETRSTLIQLIPKYVPSEKKKSNFHIKKPKDPKFVPYEPYKAAVQSFGLDSYDKCVILTKSSKNDVEIQSLASQVVKMRRSELNKVITSDGEVDGTKLKIEWEKEKKALETDIRNLKETNCHLENQLKFQAQVTMN